MATDQARLNAQSSNADWYFGHDGLFLTYLDWFIWEDPSTLHIQTKTDELRSWNDDDKKILIFTDPVVLHLPISPCADEYEIVNTPPKCTLEDLISLIHNWYKEPITMEFFGRLDKDLYDDDYYEEIEKLLKTPNVPAPPRFRLLGEARVEEEFAEDGKRRHFMANVGCVRFEHICPARNGEYYLNLG